VCVASLASFQMSTTLQRLVVLSFGCSSVMIVLCASVFSTSVRERYHITHCTFRLHLEKVLKYPLAAFLYLMVHIVSNKRT